MAAGSRITLDGAVGPVKLWHRVEGSGPWTTFLHGFPTSSWDWAKVAPLLPAGRARLYVDHLGFGDSDKPRRTCSFQEQLGLVLQLWERLGVRETALVVHDYSTSIAEEILARHAEDGWKGPRITGILLLNGGLNPELYKPLPIQMFLNNRVTGPWVARLVNKRAFDKAFARIFSPQHPPDPDELAQHWQSIEHRGGRRSYHLVGRYHWERQAQAERWTAALAAAPVPLRFAWGTLDPISGGQVIDWVRDRVPAEIAAWDDVGHYPQIEVPERVAAEVAALEAQHAQSQASPAGAALRPGQHNA